MDHVFPLIQAKIPEISVRIVGDAPPVLRQRNQPPRVIVTGWVDDIRTELRKADAIVVPIRFGGRTRIKILEAMAHGIPIAATSAGAAGLDLVDEEEVLIADTPPEMSAACIRILRNDVARERLRANARTLFESQYSAEVVMTDLANQLRTMVVDR